MKRLFNPRKRSEGEPVGEQGNTLDRIVKDKEGIRRRLEEEEKEFLSKKREAERKMIEFEKQEVHRREQEIVEKNQNLVEMKRKNQTVQDSVQNQIKGLQMKLDELRTEHKCNETSSENVISSLTDKLAEVQQSLAQRTEAFNAEGDRFPTAPSLGEEGGESSGSGLYPSLHEQATMPRSWHQVYQATSTGSVNLNTNHFRSISLHHVGHDQLHNAGHDQTDSLTKKGSGSLGSSPQISLTSNSSSRSITPRLDSDTSI